jgi:hypothetical protein
MKQGNGPRDIGISIRGSNARNGFGIRNIVIFDDGFPVTQPDGLSRSDLIDPHAYSAIDVIRGPSSALYGNYATGGALNFRTWPGGALNGAEYGVEGGSFGYLNNYLSYGQKVGNVELPESASPIVPHHWSDLNTITIAFGHGMAVAPLQAVMGVSALVNGGYLIPPTFLKRTEAEAMEVAKRVIKAETSEKMRFLMRLNAEIGTARKADVKGYYIGGKTGTAEKVINGRYAKKRVLTSFTAILPVDKPRYQLLIMLDEPQPLKETYGFITSGWNAVPTAGNVISRIAPLLGVEPRFDLPPSDRLILAASRTP